MINKIRKAIKDFFKTPTLIDYKPRLHARKDGFPMFAPLDKDNEQKHRENIEAIALTELEVQKEALQKNLRLTHRSVVIAFIAIILSFIVSVTAIVISIKSKPIVVEVPEQNNIQSSN